MYGFVFMMFIFYPILKSGATSGESFVCSTYFFENSPPLLQYALPLLQKRAFCHLPVPNESTRNNIKIQH